MKKNLLIILIVLGIILTWYFFFNSDDSKISPSDRAAVSLMPLPAQLKIKNGGFKITSDFGHAFKKNPSKKLNRAIDRFFKNLENQTEISFDSSIPKLIIDFENRIEGFPSLNDDESYSLEIKESKIVLNAKTESGVLLGLETLLQLVKKQDQNFVFPALVINDFPRYQWRGLMIDVSRHWIPKDIILRNIDAMAQVKLNVFHWHLTDYQGFRIESKKFPKLHKLGSNGDYYTQEDVKEIISYASDRGIRVVPEFDLPGHSSSWLAGYPELSSTPNKKHQIEERGLGIFGSVFDPTRESVYDFLTAFFDEMSDLFPDQYIHIGGDEVSPKTWNENDSIKLFMKNNSLKDAHELQNYFNKRLLKILEKKGKTMIGWNEILNPNLPKEQILIQSWTNHKSLWDAVKQGNQAILSSGFYLDHKKSAETHYKVDPEIIPGAINIEIDSTNWKSWKTFIEFNETIIEGSLFLFGDKDKTRAIMGLRDSQIGVEKVISNEGRVEFELNADIGKIGIEFENKGDSILGSAKVSILDLKLSGVRTGGSDMPNGIMLPDFKKIDPLTTLERKRILGGEACMWSETVDARTINSRIWPRAGAIAEKLWSPKIETTDTKDMYRRLKILDSRLEKRDIQHKTASEEIIQENVPSKYVDPIKTLVAVLKEDYFMNRMSIYGGIDNFFTHTPLNRMVDAALPESLIAHSFYEDVTNWTETKNSSLEKNIKNQLMVWIENHKKLEPLFDKNASINEIKIHSENLALLSKAALDKMNGKVINFKIKNQIMQSKNSSGGTILTVVDGLESIILK